MTDKSKFKDLSSSVIELMGGKENITYFTHCVTRLRFNVADHSKVQEEKIKELPGVLGTNWAADQFQIIIGQDVDDAFQLIQSENNLSYEKASASPSSTGTKKKKNILSAILDAISGCVSPVVITLIGGGMIKVVLLLLVQFNLITTDGGTYTTLSFVADAPFYFLPVLVGAAAAEKFGANKYLGMTLGAILLSPTFVELVETTGSGGSIFGLPIAGISYSSNVFAMILTMWIASYVERFLSKKSPRMLRSIIEPLGTLLIMAPLMLVFLAPLGATIGTYLTKGIVALYNTAGFLGLAVLCAVVPIFVLTEVCIWLFLLLQCRIFQA